MFLLIADFPITLADDFMHAAKMTFVGEGAGAFMNGWTPPLHHQRIRRYVVRWPCCCHPVLLFLLDILDYRDSGSGLFVFCRSRGSSQPPNTPRTDGRTEIANQCMDQRLRSYMNYHQDDGSLHLWLVDLAVACLPSASRGKLPFMIERGYETRMSFD